MSGPEETGSRALGARAGERGALCPLTRGQGRTAARAGQGARPVPPPKAESGPGGGRKRPPPPPRPQRAAPAPARRPPPRRQRGVLLPPSRGSSEGARPRRRRWRRLRLGWLPPRGREAAVSLAPRHPPPPAANPHPGWGEGDANYPGSGSARPPPPRPGPACTRPRIPGLACASRRPGPPPSPGSAGWVTPPPGGRGAEGRGAGDGYTTRRGGAPGRGGGRPAGRAAGSRGPPPAPGKGSPAAGPAPGPAGPALEPRRAIGPRSLARQPAAHRPSSAPPLPADRGGLRAQSTLELVVVAACHLPATSAGELRSPEAPAAAPAHPDTPPLPPPLQSPPPCFFSPLPPIPHGAQSWPTPTYARNTE